MTDIYWDPLTPELRDDPYPLWKRMRDELPVYYNDRLDFFALSRFHDIEAANRDAETFSSNHGTTLETMSPVPVETGMIIWLDPPKHTMLRKLVSRAFTPRRVSMLEDRIRDVCARLLDPHVGSGRFDYVQDFSAVLPPTVISSLLGVPEGEQEQLRHIVDDVFHIEEGVGMANETSFKALMDLGSRLGTYFAERRTNPRDDVFTDLVEAEIEDDDGRRSRRSSSSRARPRQPRSTLRSRTQPRLRSARHLPATRPTHARPHRRYARRRRSSRSARASDSACSAPRRCWIPSV